MADAPLSAIAGRNLLIAEDEYLLAAELEEMLEREGAKVVGPASTVSIALKLLDETKPDAAVLDLNLGGEISTPLAAALIKRKVPFVILTGYGDSWMTFVEFRSAPVAEKPVNLRQLVQFLDAALRNSQSGPTDVAAASPDRRP